MQEEEVGVIMRMWRIHDDLSFIDERLGKKSRDNLFHKVVRS